AAGIRYQMNSTFGRGRPPGPGHLPSGFDSPRQKGRPKIDLPSTAAFKPQALVGQPDDVPVPPAVQGLPAQEQGVRPARALPYELEARGTVRTVDGSVGIDFDNTGGPAAVFQVRSGNIAHPPRTYTVEPGRHLSDTWSVAAISAAEYDLSVNAPNGFLRAFKGGVAATRARVAVDVAYDGATQRITLT